MSDSYDDYEAKMQLAEYAWEERVVKTEQEPVAFCNGMPAYEGSLSKAQRLTQDLKAPLTINGVPLYPKTEWVGLIDEQVEDEWERITGHSIFGGDRSEGRAMYISPDEVIEFSRAIEAKLKEKNT